MDLPLEPTEEMLRAAEAKCAHMVCERFANSWNLYHMIWTEMAKAAPSESPAKA